MDDNRDGLTIIERVMGNLETDHQHLSVKAELCCPESFPAFAGHFPGKPVLPAVMQLAAVRFLISSLLEKNVVPVKVSRIKFKGMILPGDKVSVAVDLEVIEDCWQARFKLNKPDGTVASGLVLFREGDA